MLWKMPESGNQKKEREAVARLEEERRKQPPRSFDEQGRCRPNGMSDKAVFSERFHKWVEPRPKSQSVLNAERATGTTYDFDGVDYVPREAIYKPPRIREQEAIRGEKAVWQPDGNEGYWKFPHNTLGDRAKAPLLDRESELRITKEGEIDPKTGRHRIVHKHSANRLVQ